MGFVRGQIEKRLSAALGVVLWPLLLLDVNLRIGRLDDDGRRKGLVWVPALAQATRSILAGIKSRTQTYMDQMGQRSV